MHVAGGRPIMLSRCLAPPGARTFGPMVLPDLSRTLAVRFSPRQVRVCDFDCVYCRTCKDRTRSCGGGWPTPGDIASEIANTAYRCGPIDSITIAGPGEPTLHPRFVGAVGAVVSEAMRLWPQARVRIFTTGAGLRRAAVRRVVNLLDERIARVDAASDRINRPDETLTPEEILANLALLKDLTVHSCFIGGELSNASDGDVVAWADQLARLRPRRVSIYTVDSSFVGPEVLPLDLDRLEEIAIRLRQRIGCIPRILH